MEGGGKLFNCNYCNYCNRQHSLGIIFHTLTRPQHPLSAPNLEAINKQALTEDKFIPDTPETPPKRTKTPQNTVLKNLNILTSLQHTTPTLTPRNALFRIKNPLFPPPFPQKKHLFSRKSYRNPCTHPKKSVPLHRFSKSRNRSVFCIMA